MIRKQIHACTNITVHFVVSSIWEKHATYDAWTSRAPCGALSSASARVAFGNAIQRLVLADSNHFQNSQLVLNSCFTFKLYPADSHSPGSHLKENMCFIPGAC